MSIKSLARTWNAFGRRDPQWAALTDRQLSPEEFFQSGEEELRSVLDRAAALGTIVNWARALDFGCGIGRLTQAMARRFGRCDGVDIAESMIAAANHYNRYTATCRYHLNTAGDLSLFEDRTFTFIYTVLVLQHMKPDHAKAYVREFMRVLTPGGLLVFQLPSHRGPDDPRADAPRTLSAGPLPRSACRAEVRTAGPDMTVSAGQLLTVPVTVRNRGDRSWPALGRDDVRYQIQVANRWRLPDGTTLGVEEARCPLPHDLAPGAEAHVLFGVNAPAVNGEFALEFDVVQEDVGWFSDMGSTTTASVSVTVHGGQPFDVAAHARQSRPFRLRHPALYRAFKAIGVRGLYWASRYVITAIAREREVWRRGHDTVMEMHCIPEDDVAALLRECGGTLVDVEKHVMDGGFQSRRYWVVLPRANSA